jgi:hypothetical protein
VNIKSIALDVLAVFVAIYVYKSYVQKSIATKS